jgi:hypothetical protein
MKKNRVLRWILLLGSLHCQIALCAEPAVTLYNMPSALRLQLKVETEQRRRGECEQKKLALESTAFYALQNKNLLIFIGLPDYFCGSASFMPVTIDSQGHWSAGAVIESNPSLLLTDAARRLWLVSHFEIEAVFPLLHQSQDGVHWQEITLPKPADIACCFQYLKNVCVTESVLQLKLTGLEDTTVSYWQTPLRTNLPPNPAWQKMSLPPIKKASQCQTVPLTSGDWQRKLSKNSLAIEFHSAAQRMTVIMPRWLD